MLDWRRRSWFVQYSAANVRSRTAVTSELAPPLRIAVLGGGHGSYAAAADLTLQGHTVTLWRRDRSALAALRAEPRLTVRDAAGEHIASLAAVSEDLGAAVDGAELIVAPVPAFGQADLAAELAPHLRAGQVVLLPPGSFGSYVFARAARRTAGVAFAESGTLPYLTRKMSTTSLRITQRTTRLPTGVFPAHRTAAAGEVIRRAYPSVELVRDALDGALLNAGPIIHPPLIVMNAAALEHSPAFDIHNEGTQPTVRRVTDALDAERIAIREALGYSGPHFPLIDYYRTDGDEWMYGRDAKTRLVESGDWREPIDVHTHRYIREDIAYGLAFLISVARYAGVATPVADGLLAMSSAMLGEDLARSGGRTLEALDLATLAREQLRALLQDGFA
jgi:opine dehydrogenase